MIYQLGPVTIDVFPFNADSVEGEGTTDLARKDVMGTLPKREFMGPGDETLTLSGQLLPTKLGGLTELEALQGLRRSGQQILVVRGDGKVLGWHAIESIRQSHSMLGRDGVGQVIAHEVKLVLVQQPGVDIGIALLETLFSLF